MANAVSRAELVYAVCGAKGLLDGLSECYQKLCKGGEPDKDAVKDWKENAVHMNYSNVHALSLKVGGKPKERTFGTDLFCAHGFARIVTIQKKKGADIAAARVEGKGYVNERLDEASVKKLLLERMTTDMIDSLLCMGVLKGDFTAYRMTVELPIGEDELANYIQNRDKYA